MHLLSTTSVAATFKQGRNTYVEGGQAELLACIEALGFEETHAVKALKARSLCP